MKRREGHAERNGRDVIFAAPLANLIQQKLRRRLAKEDLELAGPLYGMLTALHAILGGKRSGDQLPEWSFLLRFFRERFPGTEWKGRYFMTLGKSPADTTEGFKGLGVLVRASPLTFFRGGLGLVTVRGWSSVALSGFIRLHPALTGLTHGGRRAEFWIFEQ